MGFGEGFTSPATVVSGSGDGGGGGGGATFPDTILTLGSANESFSSGEGNYIINGVTASLSYDGTSGPNSLAINNGVLQVQATLSNRAVIIFDMGEDVSRIPIIGYVSTDNLVQGGGTDIIYRIQPNTVTSNAPNQTQLLIGANTSATTLRPREANGISSFNNGTDITVTDITTTPTRMAFQILGAAWNVSWDQGTAILPTDGSVLGNEQTDNYHDVGGWVVAQSRRYIAIVLQCTADIRISAVAIRAAQ